MLALNSARRPGSSCPIRVSISVRNASWPTSSLLMSARISARRLETPSASSRPPRQRRLGWLSSGRSAKLAAWSSWSVHRSWGASASVAKRKLGPIGRAHPSRQSALWRRQRSLLGLSERAYTKADSRHRRLWRRRGFACARIPHPFAGFEVAPLNKINPIAEGWRRGGC